MKRKILYAIVILVVSVLSTSCGGRKAETSFSQGDTLRLHHAKRFVLVEHKDFTQVTLQNPWDTTAVLQTYLLVDGGKKLPASLPPGVVVRTPLHKTAIYSSVHCSLLKQLGVFSAIAGVCDLQYIMLPDVDEAFRKGKITDLGDAMNPNLERMMELNPDAVLLCPFENSGGHGKVEQLGIPLIECADYMETSPLGRAEWMRLYGRLFGVGQKADSLFFDLERKYQALVALAAGAKERPTVLSDLKTGATWYVAGGQSTTGRLYRDAGTQYLWASDTHSGSIPLSFETVFEQGHDADFWFIRYNQPRDKTYAELRTDYAPYAQFKAFRTKHIYGCNTHRVAYYEESPFQPHLMLQELIQICHPELMPAQNLHFFSNLAD